MKCCSFIYYFFAALLFFILVLPKTQSATAATRFWDIQSIDTMKYSRDLSREKLHDPTFDLVISAQTQSIASTGATHIAISTPYDEEFLPILKRWVHSARENNVKVWFRGNFSGWEGWFGYQAIDKTTHSANIRNFILNNPDLFEDGDIFSSCPECENGVIGDPRATGDASGFRQFIISEYKVTKKAFQDIRKEVASNYFSMNGDVARLIMDKKTTKDLDGIVVVDHYVKDVQKLSDDITELANSSGGTVVLGEYGVPIPDIHGDLSEQEQAEWLQAAFERLSANGSLKGLNYWTSHGGSTHLWDTLGNPRKAVAIVQKAYKPKIASGYVHNTLGEPISRATIEGREKSATTNSDGFFELAYFVESQVATVSARGYKKVEIPLENLTKNNVITLQKEKEDVIFLFKKLFKYAFPPR